MQGLYHRCTIKGMYRSLRNGAYYGMNLGSDGLSGLGDVPQPTTDALAASWCAAKGIPPGYCSIAPGVIDPSGALHIVSDPSGQPCIADNTGGPCTYNDFGGIVPPAVLAAQGITTGQYTCDPSQAQTFGGQPYMPLSCKGSTLLTQAQTLSLLQALGVNSPALAPVGAPVTSVQNVYSNPATAQAIASQIVGATVQATSDGQYAVVAPGYAVATPAVIQTISSNPAPVGSSGSVPGPTFYPAPPVYNTSTSPSGTGTQRRSRRNSSRRAAVVRSRRKATHRPRRHPIPISAFQGIRPRPDSFPACAGIRRLGAIGALVLLVLLLKK